MDAYWVTCDCEHCGKPKIFRAHAMMIEQLERYNYRCMWCGKMSSSEWMYTDGVYVEYVERLYSGLCGVQFTN